MGDVTRIHPGPDDGSGDGHHIDLPGTSAVDAMFTPDCDITWRDAGFTPFEVGQWRSHGVRTAETALVMLSAGLEPEDGRRVWRTFSLSDTSQPAEQLTISDALENGVISYRGAYAVRDWLRACDEAQAAATAGDELRMRRAERTVASAEDALRLVDLVPPAVAFDGPDGSFAPTAVGESGPATH